MSKTGDRNYRQEILTILHCISFYMIIASEYFFKSKIDWPVYLLKYIKH